MSFDKMADILMILCGLCYLSISVLLAFLHPISLLLTVPLTLISIKWLKTADWDGFLS